MEEYIRYILLNKEILNEQELEDYEIFYDVLTNLLPEDIFLKKVNELGGLENVKYNVEALANICKYFKVEGIAVYIRIRDLEKKYNNAIDSERKKEFDLEYTKLLHKYSDLFLKK